MDLTQRWKTGVSEPSSREETSRNVSQPWRPQLILYSALPLATDWASSTKLPSWRNPGLLGNWLRRGIGKKGGCTLSSWAHFDRDYFTIGIRINSVKSNTLQTTKDFTLYITVFFIHLTIRFPITLCPNYLDDRHVHAYTSTLIRTTCISLYLVSPYMRIYIHARYIQEWLGAMVCGGIVEVVPNAEGDRYFLPQHRLPSHINSCR